MRCMLLLICIWFSCCVQQNASLFGFFKRYIVSAIAFMFLTAVNAFGLWAWHTSPSGWLSFPYVTHLSVLKENFLKWPLLAFLVYTDSFVYIMSSGTGTSTRWYLFWGVEVDPWNAIHTVSVSGIILPTSGRATRESKGSQFPVLLVDRQ